MKKLTKVCLSFLLIISCSLTAFAMDDSYVQLDIPDELMEEKAISLEPISELEAYFDLIESSDSELLKQGFTTNQIDELKAVNFEEGFLEQAKLPEETLLNYGYTEEQVELIKDYDGSPITRGSNMLKASATLTKSVILSSYSSDSYRFRYEWEWNGKPVSNGKDIVAMRWSTFNSNGSTIGSYISNEIANVEYYNFKGYFEDDADPTVYEDDNSIYSYFPMEKKDKHGDEYIWAKEGFISARIERLGSQGMDYIRIRGAYGKSTTSAVPCISISGSNVGFGFSPSRKITENGVKQVCYDKDGEYMGK